MSKRKGTKNEHKTMRLMEKLGYVCTRAGGSLGAFDVIAVGASDFQCIQVKSNRGIGPKERETIRGIQVPSNCKKIEHVWNDYARQPRIRELE